MNDDTKSVENLTNENIDESAETPPATRKIPTLKIGENIRERFRKAKLQFRECQRRKGRKSPKKA